MKLLDISNNDLQNLPPELGLMRELTKINIEGNPLRSVKMSIRMGGTNNLKKYLQGKIDPNKNLNMIGQNSGSKQS
jgi:Leucine-rich repeat (LRR) protein